MKNILVLVFLIILNHIKANESTYLTKILESK